MKRLNRLPKNKTYLLDKTQNIYFAVEANDKIQISKLVFKVIEKDKDININLNIVARDKVTMDIDVKLIIESSAINSSAFLNIKCLLMGKNTLVKIIPSLEINTDSIMASHSASISNIEEGYMNFMQSRGIEKSLADEFFVKNFLK